MNEDLSSSTYVAPQYHLIQSLATSNSMLQDDGFDPTMDSTFSSIPGSPHQDSNKSREYSVEQKRMRRLVRNREAARR